MRQCKASGSTVEQSTSHKKSYKKVGKQNTGQMANKAPEPTRKQTKKDLNERRVAPLRQCNASSSIIQQKRSFETTNVQNSHTTLKGTADEILESAAK